MESDESRPGSSASNSSSSSSAESVENVENGSASSSRKSRSKSMNSNSSSASSSRDNSPESQTAISKEPHSPIVDNDGVISPTNDFENVAHRSRSASQESNQSISSNSSDGNDENVNETNTRRSVSRNQSISPVRRDSKSSRNSSVSSIGTNDERSKASENGNGQDGNEENMNGIKDSKQKSDAINISHDDLSDVSDLDSAVASPAISDKINDDENDDEIKTPLITDLRQKLDERKKSLEHKEIDSNRTNNNKKSPSIVDEINDIMDKKHDEDALDFEAEDGECNDEKEEKQEQKEMPQAKNDKKDSDGEIEEGEELEEGEVSDEGEKRPEETESKPVCRFYTRGQCTWGMSCRFLHPGVTDKGNYTMFDTVRPVPINHNGPFGPGPGGPGFHDFRAERPPIHHPPHGFPGGAPHQRPPPTEPVIESAWERGLRTAKEMMRKANKRKEQDIDFEDKKMNLTTSQDEFEKDNYYIRERSPEIAPTPFPNARAPIAPPPVHHPYGPYSPPARLPPGRMAPPPFEEDAYGRSMRYRELPPHRMPQYEDEMIAGKRRVRPTREVIVQRVEPAGRGDEWNDPWMRSKSPGREKRSKRRSYSSNSSYSSSR